MPQDAFTLSRLVKELNEKFKGGKINKIVALSNDETYFAVYTKSGLEKLFISVNPGCPRISIESVEKESLLTPTNFCMLLRKHLLSSVIDEISLVDFDRIVKISLTSKSEFSCDEKKVLYVELMGRYSNVILTLDGKVLGANRGVNSFDNGVRPLLVNKPYTYPPTSEKISPLDKNLANVLGQYDGQDLGDFIASKTQGLSQSTAVEIASRFALKHGQFSKEKSQVLFDEINEFLFSVDKNPCVYIKDGFPVDVCAFPYQTIQNDRVFFNELIQAESYYFTTRQKVKTYAELQLRLSSVVSSKIKKSKKKLSAVLSRIKDALGNEEDKLKGDLILTNIYKIKQGDEVLEAVNYCDNSLVKIELDKTLSPSKNAEKFYKKYNKKKRALSALEQQKNQAESELEYLEKLLDFISILESVEDLNSIKYELELEGLIKRQVKGSKKILPPKLKEYVIDGFLVRVGRSDLENEQITFSAKPHDVWLHVKDYSSSHVIIETLGKKVPQDTIAKVASLCAHFSKAKSETKVEVVYTEKKNVKKPPKSKKGTAIYSSYNSITVLPKNYAEFLKTAI